MSNPKAVPIPIPDLAASAASGTFKRCLFDSGATSHMCPDRNMFVSFRETAPNRIQGASSAFDSTGIGEILLEVPTEFGKSKLRLKNVLYAPKMNLTLISISKITNAGLLVTFFHNSCTISNSSGKILGVIPKRNGLYYVSGPNSPPSGDQIRSESALFASTEQVSLFDLHRRLGHLAQSSVKKMLAKGHLSGFTLDPTSDSD